MSREERTGNRRKTRKSNFRKFDLGNYLIVTDALKTEENYLNGFIRSLPESFQQRINLKIVHCRTHELVERCLEIAAAEPQYSENWIVFDRDRVVGFDSLILQTFPVFMIQWNAVKDFLHCFIRKQEENMIKRNGRSMNFSVNMEMKNRH